METLGLVAAFLVREAPFSEFRGATLVGAIQYQLSSRNHVCMISEEKLVGYCGWLPITQSLGEKWMRQEAELVPIPEDAADAAALTIVSFTKQEYLLPMIRAVRDLNPNRRFYFKRSKADGRSKKSSVYNR